MRKWRLPVGIAISVACFALALVGIEWDRVIVALRQADWRCLVPAAGALLGYLVARSIRWRILLGSEVSLVDAFAVTNIGYLVSNVLPFRLGDPARAVALGLGGRIKTSTALSTVVVERVLDMLMVVLLLAATLPFVGEAGWMREAGIVAGCAALAALALLVALAQRPVPIAPNKRLGWPQRALQWALARVPGVDQEGATEMLASLVEGLAALRSARRAGLLLLWSVITWVFTVGCYFALLSAFLDHPSLVQAAFLTSAVGLSMALPSSPGAMGVFHSVARYALQLPYGVPAEKAIVVAFGAHAFQYVSMDLLGLAGLIQQNLSFARLRSNLAATLARTEE